jgi:hypothetical protein
MGLAFGMRFSFSVNDVAVQALITWFRCLVEWQGWKSTGPVRGGAGASAWLWHDRHTSLDAGHSAKGGRAAIVFMMPASQCEWLGRGFGFRRKPVR